MDHIVYLSPESDLFILQHSAGQHGPGQVPGAALPPKAQPLIRPDFSRGPDPDKPGRRLDLTTSYAWPTCSPDSTQVATSLVRVSAGEMEVSVQVVDVPIGRGRPRTVFVNDTPGLVADGAPHYLYWSPDGRALAVLATGPEGLTLLVQDLDPASAGGQPAPIAQGAPLFFHWHPDGSALLLHHGEDVVLVRLPRTGQPGQPPGQPFDPDPSPDAGPGSRQLLAAGSGFRAAAFSPQGRHLAYVAEAPAGGLLPGGGLLMVAELVAPQQRVGAARPVLEVGPQAAFLWSPDGRELAVADQEEADTPAYSRLRLVPSEGGPARAVTTETLLAFFWSPDGRRIAWVALDLAEQRFQWRSAAIPPPGATVPMASPPFFAGQPSAQLLTMLSFFDQYAYSHSVWSPDSSRLVVTGTLQPVASGRNGHTPTGDRVWVLDPSGATAAQDVAAGTQAFWSWR